MTTMLDTKLSIRGVKKSFLNAGSSILVLDQVSIDVRAGEFLILAGKSGCGKSTLLNIVAGLESADSGEILIDGFQVRGPGPDRAMVFQDGSLFPWLTAVKNVEFGLRQRGVPPKERFERATHFLTLVGLERFANACIHELSGGMRQRVAIARALAVEPRVLLMDEPFSALDAQTREDLYIELQRIWERTAATILFVTHNIREAVTLGDRVLLLRRISDLAPGERACSVQMVVPIEIMRPRHIDDVDVARFAKRISLAMRHGDQDMSAPEVQFDEDDLYKTGLLSGLDSDLGHAL